MPKYAKMLYNGYWFAPEREMLQAAIDYSQQYVVGQVTLRLFKGNSYIASRNSPNSLYNKSLASFDEVNDYSHHDAEGFIKLNALRLKQYKDKKYVYSN